MGHSNAVLRKKKKGGEKVKQKKHMADHFMDSRMTFIDTQNKWKNVTKKDGFNILQKLAQTNHSSRHLHDKVKAKHIKNYFGLRLKCQKVITEINTWNTQSELMVQLHSIMEWKQYISKGRQRPNDKRCMSVIWWLNEWSRVDERHIKFVVSLPMNTAQASCSEVPMGRG